jgi:hypothetical protein
MYPRWGCAESAISTDAIGHIRTMPVRAFISIGKKEYNIQHIPVRGFISIEKTNIIYNNSPLGDSQTNIL